MPVSADAGRGGGGGRLASCLSVPRVGADLEGRRLKDDAASRAGLGAGAAGPGSGAPPGGIGAAVRPGVLSAGADVDGRSPRATVRPGGAARARAPAAAAAVDR